METEDYNVYYGSKVWTYRIDEPSSLQGAYGEGGGFRETGGENSSPVNTKSFTTWTVTSRTSTFSPESDSVLKNS